MLEKKDRILIFSILFIFSIILINLEVVYAESSYGEPIKNEKYEISRSKIDRQLALGELLPESFVIKNLGASTIKVNLIPDDKINEIINIESVGVIISPQNESEVNMILMGKLEKNYFGYLVISGDINDKLPINISVLNKSDKNILFINAEPTKKIFKIGEKIELMLEINKGTKVVLSNISLIYRLRQEMENGNQSDLFKEYKDITESTIERKELDMPIDVETGNYIVEVEARYNNQTSFSYSKVEITRPFLYIKLFGFMPVWELLIILGSVTLVLLGYYIIRRRIEKNKKYKMQLYANTLPKKSDRSIHLGKIAELNKEAYLDLDNLTTHSVVAGATGGGKSITAQVIIEEALMKNMAVIVFDPTAQWSGMLRKCDDKKMLSVYPRFGLKATDARAFPGSVRQIKNARQAIDIRKHMSPGQIQIFTLNKLEPSEMDTFVASIIASIFRSSPEEFPGLRVLLVFDEVHRLLPKFGGSGKGFLQIERACREFRKWGFGVMLVSQVLSDFVGEIKANINTEVQMRTRDEGDLNRIKTKYGEEFLQSLIKASVGVGMFVNP